MNDTVALELNRLIAALPAGEQTAGLMLAASLIRLSDYRNEFSAAMALVEFSEAQDRSLKDIGHVLDIWSEFAVREAVHSVFHFGHTLEAIAFNINSMPSISNVDGNRQRKAARNRFDATFGDIKQVRDAICHVAQNTLKANAVDKHMGDGLLSWGKLNGRTLTMTIDGQHYDFVIDQDGLSLLIEVGQAVYNSIPGWTPNLPNLVRRSDRIPA
jgi:hypothetical protein